MVHNLTDCKRNVHMTHYVGKGYKSLFTCPVCGRESWQHLSFLGRRSLACDGEKFSKLDRNRDLSRERNRAVEALMDVLDYFDTYSVEIGPAEETLLNTVKDAITHSKES